MINVIIPVYNNPDTLDAVMESGVRQSVFRSVRALISDDASTDHSIERAAVWTERYSDISLHMSPHTPRVVGLRRELADD